jgi:RNA polymerase sigma-70 factor (ECF subfamily)
VIAGGNGHMTRNHAAEDSASAEYARLIQEAATGSEEAMERLLARTQDVARRYSQLVCGGASDADDTMQDALLKTYRYVRRIRDPHAFRTWLFRTVRNACLMNRRRRVGEPDHYVSVEQPRDGEGGAQDVPDPGRPPDDLAMQGVLRRRLRAALADLPPTYRAVVLLRDVEGLSTRDVATLMKISEDNVKTRLRRARVMLREKLD